MEKRKAAPRGVWHGLIFVSAKRGIGYPWWGRTDVEKYLGRVALSANNKTEILT
jgi:hypothetical protein